MQNPSARRMRLYGSLLYPVVILVLIPSAVVARAATKVVTDADKGSTVHLKMGDILEVRLESNPTTGYEWSVDPKSTPLLKQTDQSQSPSTEPGVGRPIVQIFKFEPTGRGTGDLLLRYVRSWEKPSPNDQQYDLHVSIE